MYQPISDQDQLESQYAREMTPKEEHKVFQKTFLPISLPYSRCFPVHSSIWVFLPLLRFLHVSLNLFLNTDVGSQKVPLFGLTPLQG